MIDFSRIIRKFLIGVVVVLVITHTVITAAEIRRVNITEVEHNSTRHLETNEPTTKPEGEGAFDKLEHSIINILKEGYEAIKKTAGKVLNSVAKAVKDIGEDDKKSPNSTVPEGNSTSVKYRKRDTESSSKEIEDNE